MLNPLAKGGVILRTTNAGKTWVAQGTLTNQDLRSVSITNNDVWIVGVGGTILKFDGTNWTDYSWVTSEQLNDVAATHAAGIWIAGANGTLLLYDGVNWFKVPSGESSMPFSAVSVAQTVDEITVYVNASYPPLFRVFRYACL